MTHVAVHSFVVDPLLTASAIRSVASLMTAAMTLKKYAQV